MASMQEIRFHGRGGQGAVTSAEFLAQAAIMEGKYARAFPSFGAERRGAPVTAYCRISRKPIYLRSVIENPNIVVVLDSSLFRSFDVASGLSEDGILIINSTNDPASFTAKGSRRVVTVDASRIALDLLKLPVTNTVLLGALVRAADIISMDSLAMAIKHRFNEEMALHNILALERAFQEAAFAPGWQPLLEESTMREGGGI
jgi:2-oxoacid:acceptor oxidoreductase gamma subunit (pyruvate/2-ketoisovalerate family)